MAKYVLAKRAQAELWDIVEHIAQDDAESASRFLDAVGDAFERLVAFPRLGRTRKFFSSDFEKVRSWRVAGFENYLIFYQPTDGHIQVLRILHGARDIEAIFEVA